MKDSLGDRIKRYEAASRFTLPPRSCLFVRVDGKSFHTWTQFHDRPFDNRLMDSMTYAARETSSQMMGFKLAYVQSDEASFMLTDFDRPSTQPWFNNELNKIVSLSASLFTGYFNAHHGRAKHGLPAAFDARAFVVPRDDAPNVFVWRQRDWERNSLQMLARSHFSHKECLNKKRSDLHDMLMEKGINWSELSDQQKNGTFIRHNGITAKQKVDYYQIDEWIDEGLDKAAKW